MYSLLLVDDEKMVLFSMRHSVNYEEFCFSQILETTDPQAALRLLCTRRIDAAFLDIRMPGLTAFHIIKECHSRKISTIFLILTGYSDFQYARQALRYGVFDYLLKPLQSEDLSPVLSRLSSHLWERRLSLDPQILEQLYTGKETMHLLSWLDIPSDRPWFGLLVLRGTQLSPASFSPLRELRTRILLASSDEAVIFLGADSDPSAYLEEFVQSLPVPCSATFSLPGQDLTQLPSLIARIRQENTRAFSENLRSSTPSFSHTGYRQVSAGDDTFLTLLREIDAHFTQELSLAGLAGKYNISYAYCSNLFSQRMGVTFSQYIRNLRMAKAKELLANTTLSVNLVGEETGYPDYPHFAKTFRKEFGMTPSEFRAFTDKTATRADNGKEPL